MSKKKKLLLILAVTLCMLVVCSVPTFAVSESEVQAAVDEYGKDAVLLYLKFEFHNAI